MSEAEWISHNDARELVGKAIYRNDWIGSLTADETDLLYGEYGPKRHPRPTGSSGYFEVIARAPTPELGRKVDAVIGRDRRKIVQETTVLEWLDQSGFPALKARYPKTRLVEAVSAIDATPAPAPPSRGKRGPAKGTIARHVENDRSMFPQMRRLIDEGHSPDAAAKILADTGQLTGGGTNTSKATRLRKLFLKESR
jgi:hypothetical protein